MRFKPSHVLKSFPLVIFICLLPHDVLTATIPSEVKQVVTFVFVPDAQGKPIPNGTGFFVGVKDERNPERTFGYLVTAKHVLKNAQGSFFDQIYVRLNKKNGDADLIGVNLRQPSQKMLFLHPDEAVDIAVIPIVPQPEAFDFKVIPDHMLTTPASFAELHIGEGSDVFFVGLFVAYYGEHNNNPIVIFGRVAMLPEDRILWSANVKEAPQYMQLYLLETQSYGGNSGSPVFFSLGSDRQPGSIIVGPPIIKLAGIMMGSFNDWLPIGLVQTPTASVPVARQNIGIAAVTPSYLLHQILFSDELKAIRLKASVEQPTK